MGNELGVAWIAPTGASRRWCGAGCCGCSSDRDSVFLRAMVEEVIRDPRVNIDESRIYFMGISNGGFMSYRMACEHADLIAGIMPICGANYWKHAGGGAGGGFSRSTCNPSEPVHVLHIHGTRDTVIRSSTAAPSVEGWASFQCAGAVERTDSAYAAPPRDHHWGGELDKVEVRRWEGCEQNGDVELWMAPGVAHCPYSGWANARWLLDRPKGGSGGSGGSGAQRTRPGHPHQYDPDFLWELIVFLQTASDGLDPALTATFIEYLDAIFEAPPPPPPYRPAPAPSPAPSPPFGGGFRFGGGSSMGSFLSRFRRGRGTVTLSEFDDSTVFAKNPACAFPFRGDDGVVHLGCVPSPDDGGSERCKDAAGAWTTCFALDGDLFEDEPLGADAVDEVTAAYAVDIDLGALMLADLAYVADGEGEWSAEDDSALRVTLGQFDDSTVAVQGRAPVQVDGSPCTFPVSYQGQTWMECVPIGAERYCVNADNAWGVCRDDD